MESLISKIDAMIDSCDEALVSDAKRLISIRSVQGDAEEGAPFGKQPRAVLDEFRSMCQKEGLYFKDYGCGIVSGALKDGPIDVGIWLHGDVVPEGKGWSFDPYNATVYKSCIIGRGSNDNKGQLCAHFNLFRILKSLCVSLKYNPAIFLGSNEESGMKDLIGNEKNPYATGFLKHYSPPKLSLVSDGGFPVGCSGKGGLNITLRSKSPLHGMTFEAGLESAPGNATATFDRASSLSSLERCKIRNGGKVIESYSPPLHGARPDPNGNMVTYLTDALLKAGIVHANDRSILEFFNKISVNVYGESLNIYTSHEKMGKLTVFIKRIITKDGYPEITLNIRYPLGITSDEIIKGVRDAGESVGFFISDTEIRTSPYMLNTDSEIVKMLFDTSKEIPSPEKQERNEPYCMDGGTYAHFLPNAYVYGMNASLPPDDFEKGKGLSHGVDEAVSIPRLKRGMKIYARALINLNKFEL